MSDTSVVLSRRGIDLLIEYVTGVKPMTPSSPKSASETLIETVCSELEHHHAYKGRTCSCAILKAFAAALISADRREREKGYTPDTPPPLSTEILAQTASGRRYIAWFNTAAEWEEHKARYARWWPLPGQADAKEDK